MTNNEHLFQHLNTIRPLRASHENKGALTVEINITSPLHKQNSVKVLNWRASVDVNQAL